MRSVRDGDHALVREAVLVVHRIAAVERERGAALHRDGRLDVRIARGVADARGGAVRPDSAHVPRAICGIDAEKPIEVDAVRDVEHMAGVRPELAGLRNLHAPDRKAGAENAEAVVARRTGRHDERRVIRTRDRMSVVDRAKIDTPRAADGRIARKLNLTDRGIDDILCEGRRERALAVRSCALDDELLDARHLRARTVLRRRRVVVVEVELRAVLHGDRAAGRTGRTLRRVVAELHRTGLDLDVRRVGENARAERERARPLLDEPL